MPELAQQPVPPSSSEEARQPTSTSRLQHGKQAQPLCFARDAPRFSHRVQLGLACFACAMRAALSFENSRPHRMSPGPLSPQCGGQCGQIVDFQMCVLTLWA
eukprot:scaffold80752_cov36-Phaeocystis_antarctica.AAC.1